MAAALFLQVSPRDVDYIDRELRCPVNLTAFANHQGQRAVTLVQALNRQNTGALCGHTVCEEVAMRLFQQNPPRCPMCKSELAGWVPNLALTGLAERILTRRIKSGDVEPAITPWMNLDQVPFPGVGAEFKRSRPFNSWEYAPPDKQENSAVRSLHLDSETKDSLFSGFHITLWAHGTMWLSIAWDSNNLESVKKYFSDCGFPPTSSHWEYTFQTLSQMRKAFHILSRHNHIPEPEFSLIKRLMDAGDWRDVCPPPP
ncbi:MAG TPA: hypothetical protein VLF94_00070 [Chlamydiales bacterium]|nr:hypothetical protein [Chlamydiales bacterium]